jgi:hypothetical protein
MGETYYWLHRTDALLTALDELHDMLDEMDAAENGEPDADYWDARDAALDLIDRHPELTDEGRAYGLPV